MFRDIKWFAQIHIGSKWHWLDWNKAWLLNSILPDSFVLCGQLLCVWYRQKCLTADYCSPHGLQQSRWEGWFYSARHYWESWIAISSPVIPPSRESGACLVIAASSPWLSLETASFYWAFFFFLIDAWWYFQVATSFCFECVIHEGKKWNQGTPLCCSLGPNVHSPPPFSLSFRIYSCLFYI